MRKWLIRAALCLVVIAAAYAALPWYSARQLIEAAHHEDVAALERYVDFPQLRFNIRRRLKDEVQASVGPGVPPEFGGLVSAGADMILGPLVDRLISPEGVSDLIQGRKDWREFERDLGRAMSGTKVPSTASSSQQPPVPSPASGDALEAEEHDHQWQLRHWYFSGLNTVGVICGSKQDGTGVKLILRRSGLLWQLVDMHLINSENGEK